MRMNDALRVARRVAADRASVSAHRGATRQDRAIQVYGCWPEEARVVAQRVARVIDGTPRYAAGFVAVWF